MKSKDVLYDGVVLDELTVNRLILLANEHGIDVPAETTPEVVHFTLHFFGYGDKEGQMTDDEIGTPVQLDITEIGVLSVDGEVQNIGFRLNDKSLAEQTVGDRTLKTLSVNKIPHITISVQGNGKAVNTQACFEPVNIKDKKGKPIDETRIQRTVIPVSDVRIEGITAAFMQHKVERFPGVIKTATEVETKGFDDTNKKSFTQTSLNKGKYKGGMVQIPLTELQQKRVEARNPKTPPEVLAELAKDEYKYIRARVAGNRSTPLETFIELARDEDDSVRYSVAQNPSTPPEILAELAKDEGKWVRETVAENPNTPPEALAELAKDKDEWIRETVAENPNTPPKALAELAEDKLHENVLYNVALNPSTPLEVIAELATDRDEDVRANVARNPSTPPEVLTELAKDEDKYIREDVAGNPNTPLEALAELASDENEHVRRYVAYNPSTPPEVLTELAKDEDKYIREDVARNPNTPPEALAEPANIANPNDVPKEETRETSYLSKTEEGFKLSGSLDSILNGMNEKHGTERSEPSKEQR